MPQATIGVCWSRRGNSRPPRLLSQPQVRLAAATDSARRMSSTPAREQSAGGDAVRFMEGVNRMRRVVPGSRSGRNDLHRDVRRQEGFEAALEVALYEVIEGALAARADQD